MAAASADGAAKLEGVYDFIHAGGQFDVHLRSGGRFFAPKFQARANWTVTEAGEVTIEWGKYGQYKLDLVDPPKRLFEGSLIGKPESWRKMSLKRPFTTAEKMLMDSEWELEHPGGKFNIEFRADGFNHFICNDFPAHAHWRLDNEDNPAPTVYINWCAPLASRLGDGVGGATHSQRPPGPTRTPPRPALRNARTPSARPDRGTLTPRARAHDTSQGQVRRV
jgi:hypothetical protein